MHDIEKFVDNYNGITHARAAIRFQGITMPDAHLYLIDDVLIDTGPSIIQDVFEDFFLEEPIGRVVLTHIHEDHAGMAAWIQEHCQIPFYVHKNSIDAAAVPAQLSKYRQYIWGDRPGFRAEALPEVIETENFTLQVIHAPGHHPDHCVFFEENQGWLFSGDLFINETQDVAFKSENITDAIATIRKILELDFDVFFCFHAGIKEEGKALLRKKLDNFLKLQAAVADLREQGLDSRGINDKLFPQKHIITKVSKGEWSSLNMVRTL